MADNKPRIIGLIAIVLIATAGTGAVLALSKKSDSPSSSQTASMATTSTPSTTSKTSQETTSSDAAGVTYKNGTYSATGSYSSPGGEEEIGVTVTLANDIVTNVSLDTSSARGDAAEYQKQFASGYKSSVVGKNIADIFLTRVSGSSLTSTGFNDALDAIKDQAKA